MADEKKFPSNQRILDLVLRMLNGEIITFATWKAYYHGNDHAKRTFQRDMQDITHALKKTNSKQRLVRKHDELRSEDERTEYSIFCTAVEDTDVDQHPQNIG